MTITLEEKIANLRRLIAETEGELRQIETDTHTLRTELSNFEARYNRMVKPLIDQLDAARKAVQKLRDQQFLTQFGVSNKPPKRRGAIPPDQPPSQSQPANAEPLTRKPLDPQQLKLLYRQLARKYHPDLAQTEADRATRTKMMQLINLAYKERDLETLATLIDADTTQPRQQYAVSSSAPLNILTLRRLQAQYEDLAAQLRSAQSERETLRSGAMMQLKQEAKLAQARGEDLLQSLAKEIEQEYWQQIEEIDKLQNQ